MNAINKDRRKGRYEDKCKDEAFNIMGSYLMLIVHIC